MFEQKESWNKVSNVLLYKWQMLFQRKYRHIEDIIVPEELKRFTMRLRQMCLACYTMAYILYEDYNQIAGHENETTHKI